MLPGGVSLTVLQRGEVRPQLRELRDHILALLLEQTHVRVHASEHALHATTLLAEVAHEDALLLEEGLVSLKIPALLVEAVLRKLDGCLRLAPTPLEDTVALLQAPEVVDGKGTVEPRELVSEVSMALRLVYLTLKWPKLPVDLALDVLGTGKVILHGGYLALRAQLASAMLGDARRLLDELTAFLGTAGQDGVELALGDDGVSVLAKTRVMQNVCDVTQPAQGTVDQILRLARAIHPARDGDLGEVDGQGVVRIVEREGDLGKADGRATRGTREDDVLHGLAAQHLRTLLAKHPEHGICDV